MVASMLGSGDVVDIEFWNVLDSKCYIHNRSCLHDFSCHLIHCIGITGSTVIQGGQHGWGQGEQGEGR